MQNDPTHGYNAAAGAYMKARSQIGAALVDDWASNLPRGARVLDIGAGFGWPITELLVGHALSVSAVEPSPVLAAELRRRFPEVGISISSIFDSRLAKPETYTAIITIGVIFLMTPENQIRLINLVARSLIKDGEWLFSAPLETGSWQDELTALTSMSLGERCYRSKLMEAGFSSVELITDEGGNNHYLAKKYS